MTRWEIIKQLHQWEQLDTVAGRYIGLILTVINRHPNHLDRLTALGIKDADQLYKVCMQGW